jgi:hypothetical protein
MRIRIRIQQLKLMRIHADPDPDPKPWGWGMNTQGGGVKEVVGLPAFPQQGVAKAPADGYMRRH